MSTALGLLGLVVFIVGVVALAASITWTVVKISPKPKSAQPKPAAPKTD